MDILIPDLVDPASWLHDLIRSETIRLFSQRSGPRLGTSGCLFVDIGEYLVAIAETLAELAQHLSRGRHIQIYNERRMQEMQRDDDFSMLDPVDYMSDQYRTLKKISTTLTSASAAVLEDWAGAPKSCFKRHETSIPATSRRATTSHSSRPSPASFELPARPSPHRVSDPVVPLSMTRGRNQISPPNTTSPHHAPPAFQIPSYSNLERRGKMNDWTCPHGLACRHGGVDSNGELVKFSQNSAIRAHLDKHEKPWKCMLRNCPNQEGFARKDQLERHQRSVVHG